MNQSVAVAGATGRCGVHAVRQLLRQKTHVAALVRNTAKAQQTFQAELKLAQDNGVSLRFIDCDVSKPESVHAALNEQKYDPPLSGVVSTIGATSFFFGENVPEAIDFKGVVNLVDATKSAGIRNFVLMSSVSVTKPYSFISLLGMSKWKLKGENHLRQSGLNYFIVRPPRLTDCEGGKLPVWFRQGDTLPMAGTWMDRVDASNACVHAINKLLARNPEDVGQYKTTFECTSINAIPTQPTDGSFYAPNPVDYAEWSKVFDQLKADA